MCARGGLAHSWAVGCSPTLSNQTRLLKVCLLRVVQLQEHLNHFALATSARSHASTLHDEDVNGC